MNLQRLTREIFRYYPPLCASLMLHNVFALIIGYNTRLYEFIVDGCISALVMQLLLSYYFKFCIWHRSCIIYNYVVSLCITYQRNIGFGTQRDIMRYIVLAIGCIILLMFIIKCLTQNETQNIDSTR